jgi:hypothetical protein
MITLFNMGIFLLAELTTIGSLFADFVGDRGYPIIIVVGVITSVSLCCQREELAISVRERNTFSKAGLFFSCSLTHIQVTAEQQHACVVQGKQIFRSDALCSFSYEDRACKNRF